MSPIKVLIVDDEPLAQELLESYLQKIPGFSIIGKCSNAPDAFAVLSKHPCDLMLLDINMPEITGVDFLKTLKHPPKVVFTTAYSEFAVESYELNAVDYLLKPITFNRFMKAIHKVTDLFQPVQSEDSKTQTQSAPKTDDIIFVKSDGKMVKIDLSQLWFVEGLKNYVRLWTDQGKIIVHSTMKHLEEQLVQMPLFLRINKSYIINLKHVSEVDANVVRVKGQVLTIGNTYRDEVHKIFSTYNLL